MKKRSTPRGISGAPKSNVKRVRLDTSPDAHPYTAPLSPPPTVSRRRPIRSTRRVVTYTFEDALDEAADDSDRASPPATPRHSASAGDSDTPNSLHDYEKYPSTDSEAEEDARIERSMGVIRKNAASRGGDSGTKYHCDVCSNDITSTVRISCANSTCREYDLCVTCFAAGETSKTHDPRTHEFHVVEQNSIPIYTDDWGADEELLPTRRIRKIWARILGRRGRACWRVQGQG